MAAPRRRPLVLRKNRSEKAAFKVGLILEAYSWRVDERTTFLAAERSVFSGIVTRLRLLLLAVGAVTVAACFAGFTQLRHITTAHEALTRDALPVLVQTHALERELGEMLIAFERAASAQDATRLDETKADLLARIGVFRSRLKTTADAEETSGLTNRILAELAALETSVHQLLAQQETLFQIDRQIIALGQRLSRLGTDAQARVREVRLETTVQIETALEQGRTGAVSGSAPIEQLFSDLFRTSLSLTSLSTEIDKIIALARSDRRPESAGGFDEIRANIRDGLRRSAALLADLGPNDQRQELAGMILQLDALMLGPEGLMSLGEIKLRLEVEFLALRQAKLDMAGDVSRFIDEMLTTADGAVLARSATLDDATRLLSIILMLCLFLAASITLIGHTIIIEQQINRRMGRLGEAVEAVANGDLDHPIDISGKDELGDIARALRVFKQNAEELRRSNIDLERFAYVAAHDLRAPLRAVHDLGEWTLEDEDNVLTEESRSYLMMMQSRTQRLDRLLVDLLDYARAGQEDQGMAEVELGAVLDQIRQLLAPPKGFEVQFHGPAQCIQTFPTPLKQILINLISNAIKHHDRPSGRIDVSAVFRNGRLHVEVADDGPGIPFDYQDRIFELFETLKPRDDVEGSGLGLAIVRKILDRYRAELVLRSDPEEDRGATFSFDLPAEDIARETHANAA